MAQFQVFLRNEIQTITCLMRYVPLNYWSKFQTNLAIFQWITSKKPPRSSLKLYLLLIVPKIAHFKFQNLRTTNRILTKIGPDMYQLNTFNIAKMRVSMNGRVGQGRATKKPPENAMKLRGTCLEHLKPV